METKLIKKARIARYLVNHGHQIVDIKPDRENKDRTVFVFKVEDKKQFEIDFEKAVYTDNKDSKGNKSDVDIEKAKKLLIEIINRI